MVAMVAKLPVRTIVKGFVNTIAMIPAQAVLVVEDVQIAHRHVVTIVLQIVPIPVPIPLRVLHLHKVMGHTRILSMRQGRIIMQRLLLLGKLQQRAFMLKVRFHL